MDPSVEPRTDSNLQVSGAEKDGNSKPICQDRAPLSESEGELEDDLSKKFRDINERAEGLVKRAIARFELSKSGSKETKVGFVDLTHIDSEEIEKLQRLESPFDREVSHVLQIQRKISKEIESLKEQLVFCQKNIGEIEREIQGLEGLRGLIRKKFLNRQKIKLEEEEQQLSKEIREKEEFSRRISEKLDLVLRRRQEALFKDIVEKEVVEIIDEYYRFLQEIYTDGRIPTEIIQEYIRQVISPTIDKITEEEKLTPGKKQDFFNALQNYISHREATEEERERYKQTLDIFLSDISFWKVRDLCRPLLEGYDKTIVRLLIEDLVIEKITLLRKEIESQRVFGGPSFNTLLKQVIYSVSDDPELLRFRRRILELLTRIDEPTLPSNMDFWKALLSSPTAKQIFGEILEERDKKYYKEILEGSLSDSTGEYIDRLLYYPTPDAIRNLVIIAAADYKNYRTVHANWCLSNLAERTDWPEILDKAEEVYPELKSVRPILENWQFREYGSHPKIKERVISLAFSIVKGSDMDSRLKKLAAESLPSSLILDILVEKKLIEEADAIKIKEAETLLRELSEITKKKSLEGEDVPYIVEDIFIHILRKALFTLLESEESDENRQRHFRSIKGLIFLSERILQNNKNYQVLRYLTSKPLLERVVDSSLEFEDLKLLVGAYETIPALLTNEDLLGEFCRQFKGEQTVKFFKSMCIEYQDQEERLVKIIRLVNNNKLSEKRALELPRRVGDVLSSPIFDIALRFPEVFLETDEGLNFLTQCFPLFKGREEEFSRAITMIINAKQFDILKIPPEKLGIISRLLNEIDQSSLLALQKVKDKLLILLLDSLDPERDFERIKSLFETNNLPEVARNFMIFTILYFTPGSNGETRFDREMESKGRRLSPVLRKASRRRRLDTIFNDLLRVSIESGDPSLRNYLLEMKRGQGLLDKVESEGIRNLTKFEKEELERFLDRLDIICENSSLRRMRGATSLRGDLSIEARIAILRSNLGVREDQRILDRVIEMFAKRLGYDSIEEILDRMDEVKRRAHERNLSTPRIKEGYLELNPGDLLKGVHFDVLWSILKKGIIAREYLGERADSDRTPFDTDVVILPRLDRRLEDAIKESKARDYGNLILVIRNRGQFVRTDRLGVLDLRYNYEQYELIHSGVVDAEHYGIRTGLPSTQIDAIIVTGDLLEESPISDLKRREIFFYIANNGFYIPVAKPTGEVIFTEEDYEKYRLEGQEIGEILKSKQFYPFNLIELLKKSPFLKSLYEMSTGVWEGYSLEEHTLMVMSQFEKYFSERFHSDLLTKDEFRLMLALHDIGKPLSVERTGSTSNQHEYTRKILIYALPSIGIDPQKVETIISIVDQDVLGEYFRDNIDVYKAAEQINRLAEMIGASTRDLVEILKIFYVCDAGAYTSDAGGVSSLDYLFSFGEDGEGKPTVSFSPKIESKYQELLRELEIG